MNDNYICETNYIHKDIIDEIKSKLTEPKQHLQLAEIFNILGDPTRIKIFQILSISEVCVCDLAALINLSQSAISHQLRFLRQANVVNYRKEGKIVYYALRDKKIKKIIDYGVKYLNEK